MNEHNCNLHNVPFDKHEKDGKTWYSHKLIGGKWCNEPKIEPQTPATPQKPTETREVVREPIVNPKVWEDKDLRIARESALHTASRNNLGKQVDPALLILEANEYVDFIYKGLEGIAPEEVEEDLELPSEIFKASPFKQTADVGQASHSEGEG
mgnify:CR=1 FL=1